MSPLSETALRARAADWVRTACRATSAPQATVAEIGCGARSHLPYGAEIRLVGVDASRAQLQRNTETNWRVEADAARLPLATGVADAAVSWDVLEHVQAPALALAELSRIVRPGGIIVLALPNVVSLKGLVTKYTPWRVHVWVYRHLLGDATAGGETSDQFPTTMRLLLRTSSLRRLAAGLRLDVLLLAAYEGPVPRHFRHRHRAAHILLTGIGRLSRALSLGHYDATASDVLVVLRKKALT